MNLSEFKAWFEGFTENITGEPDKKQWARIKKRVLEITGEATSQTIFIDRYVEPYRRHWSSPYEITCNKSATEPLARSSGAWSSAGRAEALAVARDSTA